MIPLYHYNNVTWRHLENANETYFLIKLRCYSTFGFEVGQLVATLKNMGLLLFLLKFYVFVKADVC